MSRSKTGGKGPGFEYWTARPGNRCGGHHSTRAHAGCQWMKRYTHKAERREGRDQCKTDGQNSD